MEHAELGDMLIDVTHANCRNFRGIKLSIRIVQIQGGFPVLDLIITDAKANEAVRIEPPERRGCGGRFEVRRSVHLGYGRVMPDRTTTRLRTR